MLSRFPLCSPYKTTPSGAKILKKTSKGPYIIHTVTHKHPKEREVAPEPQVVKSTGWKEIVHTRELADHSKISPMSLPKDDDLDQIYIPLSDEDVKDGSDAETDALDADSAIVVTKVSEPEKRLGINDDGWPIDPEGKPMEPEPYECCGNDCPNCVWIQYDEQMQKYKEQLKKK
jgi:hypothetical protein